LEREPETAWTERYRWVRERIQAALGEEATGWGWIPGDRDERYLFVIDRRGSAALLLTLSARGFDLNLHPQREAAVDRWIARARIRNGRGSHRKP
jgi:hypothetical protein